MLTKRGVDTHGLERADGKSFHWAGSYLENLNEAQTLNTELNVFETFSPKIPAAYEDSEYLFLANIDPVLQENVRSQMSRVRMVCGDTMNYWITGHREKLARVLKGLDALLINDTEARMLANNDNLVSAAKAILKMGPKTLIVKHGEYGATAFFGERSFGKGIAHGDAAVSRACIAAGRGGRSDGSGRFIRRGIFRLPRFAAGIDAAGIQDRDVLWRSDGIVCGGDALARSGCSRWTQRDRSALWIVQRSQPP